MTSYKHLSYEDRKNIEDGLNQNKSFSQIAREINKSHSTILREVDRNKVYYKPSSWNNCSAVSTPCSKLKKTPYVCNGCKSRSGCRKERYTYYARKANDSYKELISSCRQGINLSDEEIYDINKIITPLVKKGQTTNHLYINHPEVLNFSKVSFYNYINAGVFEFGPLDFPRIVKHKKRKHNKKYDYSNNNIDRTNHTYLDYLSYIHNYPNSNVWQLDFLGAIKSDSKNILSFILPNVHFTILDII